MFRRFILIAALCCTTGVAPTIARADDNACSLITKSTLGSLLGVEHVQVLRDITGKSSTDNTFGDLHSVCNGVGWSGAKPTSRRAALQAVRSGRAAAFAIDTWEPDESSPYAEGWSSKQFPALIQISAYATQVLPVLGPFARRHAHAFEPSTFGIGANGFIATPFPGIAACAGVWWHTPEHEILNLSIGVGSRVAPKKKVNKLGEILVGAFGMLNQP